ncbi:hypothetical protein GCM10023321_48780 [Pseudonocardia eucalypti]|uniref:Mce-associated membrane protein n=1 Tax=Pseudonocardia eucalypti TaxID=648755 RepID=A0ABP9QJ87_9PSEU|nr:Mce-associated membrane protein [Pseudonocardia eucalypti]
MSLDTDREAAETAVEPAPRGEFDGHRRAKAKKAKKVKKAETETVDSEPADNSHSSSGSRFAAVLAAGRQVPAAVRNLAVRLCQEARERPKRTRRIGVLVLLGLVLVTGLFAYQARQYQLAGEARAQALTAAKDSVTELLTYNHRTIDRQAADTEKLLTGKFKDDYLAQVRDVVTKSAKDTQVAIQTAVVNGSVVSSKPDHVVLLLFVNQQTTTKASTDPILTASRVRVTLEHQDRKWLVSALEPV